MAISRADLQVGQWIRFETQQETSSENKGIYESNQRFLVFRVTRSYGAPCQCKLASIDGKILWYSSTSFCLESGDLKSDTKIIPVTEKNVENIHGAENLEKVYKLAQQYLKKNPLTRVLYTHVDQLKPEVTITKA